MRTVFQRMIERFRASEAGNATIEFVIIFPVFITLFLATFESGFMMTRNVMLERAVDLSIRDLRLGQASATSFQGFKDTICDNSFLIKNCDEVIQVELRPVDTGTWAALPSTSQCRDVSSSIDPIDTTTFEVGANNELMLVRVCALFDPFFPTTALGLELNQDGHGNFAMVVTGAFVNEPS